MFRINLRRTFLAMSIAILSFLSADIASAQSHNIDIYSSLCANVANRLGLTGESAGDFAAIIIKKQGYRGYEAGKIAGQIAHVTNASGKETEQILAVVLNELNPPPEEAEQIAATVEVETGEKVSVVRDVGEVEVPRVRKVIEEEVENRLVAMADESQIWMRDAPKDASTVRFFRDLDARADRLVRDSMRDAENASAPATGGGGTTTGGSGSSGVIGISGIAGGTTVTNPDGSVRALTKEEALRRIIIEIFGVNIPEGSDLSQLLEVLGNTEIETTITTSPTLFQ